MAVIGKGKRARRLGSVVGMPTAAVGQCEAAPRLLKGHDPEGSCNQAPTRRNPPEDGSLSVGLLRGGKLAVDKRSRETREAWERRICREGEGFKNRGEAVSVCFRWGTSPYKKMTEI